MTLQEEHDLVAGVMSNLTQVEWFQGVGEAIVVPAPEADGSRPAGFGGWDFGGERATPCSFAGDSLVEGSVLLDVYEQKGSRGKLIRAAAEEAKARLSEAGSGTSLAFLTFTRDVSLATEGFVGRRFNLGFKTIREGA